VSERLRILIVEDNPADADFIHEMLPQAGPLNFEVKSAQRLSEAVAQLERKNIDLVLLDLGLPDSQGLQTLHALQKAASDIPVIVMTGNDDHELAMAAVRDGAQDYLVKGQISGRPLMRTVRYALARQKAAEALRQSEAKFRTLAESIPQKLFVKDRDSRFLSVNESFARCLHLRPEDIVGKTDSDFIPQELAAKYRADDQRIMRTGQMEEFEEKAVEDGREIWVHTVKTPVRNELGQITGVFGIFWDITEQKQAEAELNRERNLWRSLLDHSLDNIYFKDTQSRFIKASKTQARYFGVESPDALVGKTDFDFCKEAEARSRFEDEQEIIRTGRPMIAKEEREERKPGHVTWVSSTKMPLRDETGKIIGIMGISRDITEHKQKEEQLRQLSSAVEHSPASIIITDLAGNIEYVNPKFTAVTGYSPEEVIGKNPRVLKSGETPAAEYQRMWQAITSGVDWQGEFHNRKKSGELFWEAASISSISDGSGKIAHFIAVKEDITERKRVEQQVLEALDFNHTIISGAPVGIIVFKASGQCVLANECAARVLNATVPQLLEQDFRQIVSWRASGLFQAAEEVLATKEPRQCEPHFVSTFNQEVWLVCHLSHFIQHGEPHLLLVFNDVTEKKKLEVQFLRSQRMESLGTLAGGIAHDLNNVLAPLLISVQLLKGKITDPASQKLLQALESNVHRGADLVKQVLVFGRGVKSDRGVVQIQHIAQEIKEIVRETFPKTLEFQLEIARDLGTVSCDPTQIHQVLLNLCINARDAMPNGGKLSLRLENVTLDQAYASANLDARPGPYVVISVKDTGTGIPVEIQERIFEPFFTTKESGKGTGLGLSTSLGIVRSHGGFIHFESESGKGSVFKVYLPASHASAAGAATETSWMPRGHNELILVVDDEAAIREIAQATLEHFGYRVLLAADGAKAVEIYKARRDDIAAVITDMAMPVMDGPATVIALTAINPDVKIIGSSGLASGVRMFNKGGDMLQHFIHKPYTSERMLQELHAILQENSKTQSALKKGNGHAGGK